MLRRPPSDEPSAAAVASSSSSLTRRPSAIDFLHPGYRDSRAILLSLPALDDGGIDHDTALVACALLAGNRWHDAFFSLDAAGTNKVARPADGILRMRSREGGGRQHQQHSSYYFHVSSREEDRVYPIVARFTDWRFPHDDLPPLWARLRDQSMSSQQEQPDYGGGGYLGANNVIQGQSGRQQQAIMGNCFMSNFADGVESAHIVPTSLRDWWMSNLMQRYALSNLFSVHTIDGPANRLPLRSDLHKMFDERHLCFVPKQDGVGGYSGQQQGGGRHITAVVAGCTTSTTTREEEASEQRDSAVTAGQQQPPQSPRSITTIATSSHATAPAPVHLTIHVFNPTPSGQLQALWHNRLTHALPPAVAVECLLVRFAYTVFSPMVFGTFLPSAPCSRRVMVWDEAEERYEVEEASPERCRAIWARSRARSESPKKRNKNDSSGQDGKEEAGWYEESSDDDGSKWGFGDEEDTNVVSSDDDDDGADSGYHGGEDAECKQMSSDSLDVNKEEAARGRRRKRSFEEVVGIMPDDHHNDDSPAGLDLLLSPPKRKREWPHSTG